MAPVESPSSQAPASPAALPEFPAEATLEQLNRKFDLKQHPSGKHMRFGLKIDHFVLQKMPAHASVIIQVNNGSRNRRISIASGKGAPTDFASGKLLEKMEKTVRSMKARKSRVIVDYMLK